MDTTREIVNFAELFCFFLSCPEFFSETKLLVVLFNVVIQQPEEEKAKQLIR